MLKIYKGCSITNTSMWNSIFVILCMFCCVPFYFRGITVIHKILYYIYAFLPIIIVLGGVLRLQRRFVRIVIFICACFSVIFCITLFNGLRNYDYIEYSIRYLIGIMGLFSTYILWRNKSKKCLLICFEEVFIRSAILYISSTVIFFVFPTLRDAWLGIIVNYTKDSIMFREEYGTRYGFAGFSGYNLSIYVSMALLFAIYLYCIQGINKKKNTLYILCLLLGSIFYSRTGTIATIGVMIIFAFYNTVKKSDSRLLRVLINAFILVAVLLVAVYAFVPHLQRSVEWILEVFINYALRGKAETISSREVIRFYQNFRPDFDTLMFGKGIVGDTDVGFMREIIFGGIPYMILVYCMLLYLIVCIGKSLKEIGGNGKLFVFLILINLIVFELKGQGEYYYIRFLLPLYVCMIERYAANKKESVICRVL